MSIMLPLNLFCNVCCILKFALNLYIYIWCWDDPRGAWPLLKYIKFSANSYLRPWDIIYNLGFAIYSILCPDWLMVIFCEGSEDWIYLWPGLGGRAVSGGISRILYRYESINLSSVLLWYECGLWRPSLLSSVYRRPEVCQSNHWLVNFELEMHLY